VCVPCRALAARNVKWQLLPCTARCVN
jgi:hypothetical protein